jgi:hypothetical protein
MEELVQFVKPYLTLKGGIINNESVSLVAYDGQCGPGDRKILWKKFKG